MRAPGVAAIALGAVVALSGVLGLTSRSEAAPSDAPTPTPPRTTEITFTRADSATVTGFDVSIPGAPPTGSVLYQAAGLDGTLLGGTFPTTADFSANEDALGYWSGACTNITSDVPDIDCRADFGATRPSGLWALIASQQDATTPGAGGSSTFYVYIPPAPTLQVSREDGFSGTGIDGDTVDVVDSSGDSVCETTVGRAGTWSCDPESDFDGTFAARQTDAGDAAADGLTLAGFLTPGGISLDSATQSVPVVGVQQDFRPAGVTVTAQQGADSEGTSISFFHFDDGEEGGWGLYGVACPGGEGSVEGTNVCQLSGLAPGDYESYVTDAGPADAFDSWWVVPQAPVITSAVAHANRTVTLGGTGVSGDAVRVIPDGSAAACDGTVVAAGQWTCTVPALSAGRAHTIQAYLQDIGVGDPTLDGNLGEQDGGAVYTTGGLSAASATVSVKIAATATETPPPSATAFPDWFFSITGEDLNNVHPGDRFTVTGSGLPPGAMVSGELHSKTVSIGSATVQPDGTFTLPVTVPADFPAGAHQIVMTLTPPGSAPVSSQQPMKVVPARVPNTDDTPTPSDSPSPLGSSEGPGIDHHGPNSNILTHGLNSIADVLAHPAKIPAALEIGLVLLIFAVLPGHLLNATLAEQYERFNERRSRRRRATAPWWSRLTAFLHRAPFIAGLALTTATALLFGFADPRFGFSLASLRLFLGLAIALAVVSYLTNAVVSRLMRGRWKVDVQVNLRPLGLILTVVGVVVSRVLDFSPGFLIGLVLGLVISEKHLATHAWRAVLMRTGILLGLALLAWLAFSLFDAKEEGGTFLSELAVETLVAITTEAVVGLLVELLPLKLLEGEKLYEKSKVLWGALYLVAIFIFVVAVVPWEGNWAELGNSLWAWIGIVVGFGIIATGIYLYFRIRGGEEHREHKITDEDDDELVPIGSEDD